MRTRTTAAAAAAVLLLTLTACGGGDSNAAGKPKPSATPSNTWPGGLKPPPAAADLEDWYNDTGEDHLSTIYDDLDKAGNDLNDYDLDAATDSCSALTAHVETARADESPPDKIARQHWEKMLEHLEKAGSECTVGATGEDGAAFDRTSAELSIGKHHMDAFNDRYTDVTGSYTDSTA